MAPQLIQINRRFAAERPSALAKTPAKFEALLTPQTCALGLVNRITVTSAYTQEQAAKHTAHAHRGAHKAVGLANLSQKRGVRSSGRCSD